LSATPTTTRTKRRPLIGVGHTRRRRHWLRRIEHRLGHRHDAHLRLRRSA